VVLVQNTKIVLLAKIIGFAFVLFGAVSFVALIPTYRKIKSDESKLYLTPNKVILPTDMKEVDFRAVAIPVDEMMFRKVFFLPSALILILGITTIAVAFKCGNPKTRTVRP